MTIYKLPHPEHFEDKINDKNTHLFTLQNRAGMQIALSDYGARLISALVPDKNGNLIDVVLGFDSLSKYINAKQQYHGATIGRVSNRIANGEFILEGVKYTLDKNNKTNALHGGENGFHNKIWDRQLSFTNRIDFYYVSADGEEGYPGEVKVNVSYEITNDNEIIIKYRATTNKDTILNLTNHAFFNLNGEGNADILNHYAQINAQEYLPINAQQIPLGYSSDVKETPFDFSSPKRISTNLDTSKEQIHFANGFDHSFVNKNPIDKYAARVYAEESGIELQVFTDLPTLHLYTGNFLSDDMGKSGHKYIPYGGFCLEAQHYIDSPNQPNFPEIILKADQEYIATIIYKFGILK